ncbi:MAG: serine/threonine protein kinase [Gemmataceae bacterium]|nr:serine/threonine protein kinase [Gemmataceae bacterium]MDW8266058.1 serine/threonine-protein kinase [Gemmataceae bacterium]
MALTVQNVYGLLIRSKLLPLEEAKAMFDRWQAESKNMFGNVDLFTRWMVANRYVTEYQAKLLASGYADGFFLNEYKILDRIGRGRMAGVYKAVHPLGATVAIKVLPPSRAKDPHFLARFRREARMALKLKHPNVVRSFHIGACQGLYFIVMEYLEGETLEETLQRRKRLTVPEAARIIHQALLGLQHIHEQGMVHRDLKPANLMLVPPGNVSTGDQNLLRWTVKILDIGLGRTFFDESEPTSLDEQLTGEGVLLGTPDYLAPEQARSARSVDIRADIYSLGCVFYHTLTGQPPFPDTNIITQMIRHSTEAPRPVKQFNPEVSDGVQQVLNVMMAKDPGQRYATPEQAARALQPFLTTAVEPSRPSDDPAMRSYLAWVETQTHDEIPVPSGQALSGKAAPPGKRAKGSFPGKKASKKHRLKKLKQKSVSSTKRGRPPAPPPGEKIDVELVPYQEPRRLPGEKFFRRYGLSRRDVVMLFAIGGISIGAILSAIGLGWAVAWFRRWQRSGSEETGESSETDGSTNAENK